MVSHCVLNHPDDPAVVSSDCDSTYETIHSDSSDFAQNEEDGEARRQPYNMRELCRTLQAETLLLHTLLPSEVILNETLTVHFKVLRWTLNFCCVLLHMCTVCIYYCSIFSCRVLH